MYDLQYNVALMERDLEGVVESSECDKYKEKFMVDHVGAIIKKMNY